MAVAVHQGNLFRTLISGVIIMGITLWIATQTIGLHTQLAANAGTLKAGGMVASMDGVVRRLRLLIQLFTAKCGWLRGHRHHLSGRRFTDTASRSRLHRRGKSRKKRCPQQSTGMS